MWGKAFSYTVEEQITTNPFILIQDLITCKAVHWRIVYNSKKKKLSSNAFNTYTSSNPLTPYKLISMHTHSAMGSSVKCQKQRLVYILRLITCSR